MGNGRKNAVRNYLLSGCFLASILGLIAIVGFLSGVFEITVAHVRAAFFPMALILFFDFAMQIYANEKLLTRFFQWLELKDRGETPELNHSLQAQIQMLRFPIMGGSVSLALWIISGVLGVLLMDIFSDVFPKAILMQILIATLLGGAVSIIFQYYFYKVIFHRRCPDLFAEKTDILNIDEKLFRIDFNKKLLISFIVLIFVPLLFSAIMSHSRSVSALVKRQLQILKPVSQEVLKMKSEGASVGQINENLNRIASYLGQEVFIFNHAGEIVYGTGPKGADSALIKRYLKEFDSIITKILRLDGSYYARNMPDSSDLIFWAPMAENLYVGSFFTSAAIDSTLSNFTSVYTIMIIFYLLAAAWVARMAANDVSGPLKAFGRLTEKVAMGNLEDDTAILSEDELSDMARSLQKMIEGLRGMIARIGRSAEQVDSASVKIIASRQEVGEGSDKQARVVEDSTLAVKNMKEVVSNISDNIEVMATNSNQSSKVVFEMENISKEVNENVSELNVLVENTTSAIYEMNATINEINENVEALRDASEETAASMIQMDMAIKEVGDRTKQTLELSEKVMSDSIEGVKSVQSTIQGIGKVEEGVRDAAIVINELGGHAEHIGEILTVITDIADQTNLLALNAAIIAAQAGERGRGFAVVADEIKKLSDRTSLSIKEIKNLVGSIQTESKRAVTLMERESQNVENGVNIAFQAGQALEKIQKSAQRSGDMVRMIAKATEEQAGNSKKVAESVSSIAERVSHIAKAIGDQANGAQQISSAAGEMKNIAPKVQDKSRRQLENGKRVTLAMENIIEMISYVQKSQSKQQDETEKIMESMGQIKSVYRVNVEAVSNLNKSVAEIETQSNILKEEIKSFILPHEDLDLEIE